jgi:hypothetical protein
VGGTIYAAARPFLHLAERNYHTRPYPPMVITGNGSRSHQGRRKGRARAPGGVPMAALGRLGPSPVPPHWASAARLAAGVHECDDPCQGDHVRGPEGSESSWPLRRRLTPFGRLEPVEADDRTGQQDEREPPPRVPVPAHLQPTPAAQPRQRVGSDRDAVLPFRAVRFPGPHLRTGRASSPASGSPQARVAGQLVHPVAVHGVGIWAPR